MSRECQFAKDSALKKQKLKIVSIIVAIICIVIAIIVGGMPRLILGIAAAVAITIGLIDDLWPVRREKEK
jgi:flagellar biosynthesis component FlhA